MPKLMLVEDDNNLREIYEARLQAEGYDIVTAHDGEEALVVAKAERPELIISDVMMPKISGFEMLDILRNTEGLKDVKIIMLTALGQSDDQQRADRLGADAYLVKSQVTLEDIVKVAQRLLGGEEAEAEAPTPEPVIPQVAPVAVVAEAPEPAPVLSPAPLPAPDPTPVFTEPPVAAAPIPEPPAVEPPAAIDLAAPAVQPDSLEALLMSEEAADVQAQIDQFANEVTPVEPEVVPESQPEIQSQPQEQYMTTATPDLTTAVAPAAPSPQSAGNDDVLASAMESLIGVAPSPAPDDSPLPGAVTATVPGPNAPAKGGERVIAPLASVAKPDINTLLSLEQAKEQQPGTTITNGGNGVVTSNVQPAPGPGAAGPMPGQTIDPNSIAL